MRIAIATQDLTRIDAHFGWARNLMIFDISVGGYHHLRTRTFRQGLTADGRYDKVLVRLAALRGCSMVFAAQVGMRARADLERRRIIPLLSYARRPIAEALDHLVGQCRQRPGLSRYCGQKFLG